MTRKFFVLLALYRAAFAETPESFAGRWTIQSDDAAKKVFWLEVTGISPIEGQFFGVTGGRLETLRDSRVEDGQLRFRVERPASEPTGQSMAGAVDLRLSGQSLAGTVTARGKTWPVRGWRAPPIAEYDDGSWTAGTPSALLSGGLSKWRDFDGREREWQFRAGVLSNLSGAAKLLVSRENFWNFRLNLEYRLPKDGNAGIGLRHHYELQLAADHGLPPDVHGNASLYSQIAPSLNASRPAGVWQTMEVTLIGRDLTVVLNGTRVIDRQRIRGLTGLALDADETQPGPVSLQGDHGKVEYRNVTITPLSKKPVRVLVQHDLTKGKPAGPGITVRGGAWDGGWEVTGDRDRILVDTGRDIRSGFLEVTVTRRGALEFESGRHKRNWLGLFASPEGHQSPGGYARAGGKTYGFSKAEIFSSARANTICEKKFGAAEDWTLDGKTEHTVRAEIHRNRMTWRLGAGTLTHCGDDSQPVTHFRYAMLGGLLDQIHGWHHGSLIGLKVLRFRIVSTE